MSASVQNLEEAASIASEFITSLDNLPNEVQHLLQEIKHRDLRSQDLQQEISKEQSRYIRHSLRHSSPSATTPGGPSSASPAPTNGNSLKPHIPAKIATSYAELDQLADEKIELAQRIIDLLAKTRARLDFDLTRVRTLQGEIVLDNPGNRSTRASTPVYAGDYGRNASIAIGESLRNALLPSSPDVLPLTPTSSVSAGSAQKKRRLTATSSIKLPSPAPQANAGGASTTYPRSRLSRQIHPPRPAEEDVTESVDPDAEGDEEFEGDDAEDSALYCFCQKPGAGEMMIGCDNPDCPYQWFHISCVGVKQPLPDKWYCSECKSKGAGAPGRKGRKKAS